MADFVQWLATRSFVRVLKKIGKIPRLGGFKFQLCQNHSFSLFDTADETRSLGVF